MIRQKWITRFNPTISGPLHVGHLYVALVNATEAHNSGGEFILRIDDNQDYWRMRLGDKLIEQLTKSYADDLSMFMKIDLVERQSEMPSMETIAPLKEISKWATKPTFIHDQNAELVYDPEILPYPYAPLFTLEKVLWDFWENVNWLIRGDDILPEFSLYCHYIDLIGLRRVRQTFLPRLKGEKDELRDVSKTFGSYRIRDQVDRLGVDKTLEYLKQSCLIDPKGEFEVTNVKCDPVIVGFDP